MVHAILQAMPAIIFNCRYQSLYIQLCQMLADSWCEAITNDFVYRII
jgi:hypothetical protein